MDIQLPETADLHDKDFWEKRQKVYDAVLHPKTESERQEAKELIEQVKQRELKCLNEEDKKFFNLYPEEWETFIKRKACATALYNCGFRGYTGIKTEEERIRRQRQRNGL